MTNPTSFFIYRIVRRYPVASGISDDIIAGPFTNINGFQALEVDFPQNWKNWTNTGDIFSSHSPAGTSLTATYVLQAKAFVTANDPKIHVLAANIIVEVLNR